MYIKLNYTFIDNLEDLDIVMPMYNVLKYSDNYSMTSRSLWNYYRDEINDDAQENAKNTINNNKTITSKSFKYKAKLIGAHQIPIHLFRRWQQYKQLVQHFK